MFIIEDIWNKTIDINNQEHPYLEVKIIPGEYSNASWLGFDYELNMTDQTHIELNITFDHAEWISLHTPLDYLEITFWGPF